jgi:RNA polymerase sigma factor (sigma-70 family)
MKTKCLNEEEIAVLFTEYFCELKKYVLNFTSCVDFAEDSAQLSFMKLCKSKPFFEDQESAKHWLKKVARNSLFTLHKKNKKYIFIDPQESNSEIQNLEPMLDIVSGFESLASSEEEVSCKTTLVSLMNKLTKKQKEVLRLRYFENLTYEQIAQKTKNKVTNVGFLLNEGKRNLRKFWDSYAKAH